MRSSYQTCNTNNKNHCLEAGFGRSENWQVVRLTQLTKTFACELPLGQCLIVIRLIYCTCTIPLTDKLPCAHGTQESIPHRTACKEAAIGVTSTARVFANVLKPPSRMGVTMSFSSLPSAIFIPSLKGRCNETGLSTSLFSSRMTTNFSQLSAYHTAEVTQKHAGSMSLIPWVPSY